jgi:UDP-N-acetylmuramate dehydrogenase
MAQAMPFQRTGQRGASGLRARYTKMERPEPGSAPGVELRGELRLREPMARHTSWRAGGVAERAYFPKDLADLCAFLRSLPPAEPVLVVGLGSNLLVRDGGLRGTVIFTHRALGAVRVGQSEGERVEIRAEAGVACPKLARFAATRGLAGAEFLAGIPGTVGGALAMNAGCYGGETWRIVGRVETVDRAGRVRTRAPEEYEIGYRHVALRSARAEREPHEPSGAMPPAHRAEEWFVAGIFRLARGDAGASREKIRRLLARRLATQPLDQPNAGSVFRNPPGDYAARLIEACGLKGRAIGGAAISSRHANFIVNRGGARAADIEALIELAQRSVEERFGIRLEREVRIVGEP